MPTINDNTGLPRKDLHIFYVLDTSGSMTGTKISSLNHAVEETIAALGTLAQSNSDAKLKIAAMEFNSSPNWITQYGPEDVEDFVWSYLTPGGITDVGSALEELNSKLSKNGYLNSMTGALMPVIIFMTDGEPTDDYKPALEKIRQNKWFKRATKIGFAIGDEADKVMISEVVGNSEAVIQTNDMSIFGKLIRFVTVTASMLNSQSQTSHNAVDGASIVNAALENFDLDSDTFRYNLDENQYNKEPAFNPEPSFDDEFEEDGWD